MVILAEVSPVYAELRSLVGTKAGWLQRRTAGLANLAFYYLVGFYLFDL